MAYTRNKIREERSLSNSQLLTINEDIRNQYKTELKSKIEQQTEWNDI